MPRTPRYDPKDEGDWLVPKDCELIDGAFVESTPGTIKALVAGNILCALANHSDKTKLGWVFPSRLGYRFFPPEKTLLRKVSVSFIRRGRFPRDLLPHGDARIPPDLGVIVLGVEDKAMFVNRKLNDFLVHGTLTMWIIDPFTKIALIWRKEGTGRLVRENDYLDGEDVVPGFRKRLSDVLEPVVDADPPIQILDAE